ncbi:hypothetical protein GALMADRAFT_217308 [Galerina marginata CBS 339.88]|uniref:F-box domain-containing protein n=1 Tax=Galerina marginata (strain CBS 339.88) TaxID=685588 RepID=A0A067S532_GALM3|nr:hypothetical protein GALMADRAFT_217308 [Galerina marginata CBS 339.88]
MSILPDATLTCITSNRDPDDIPDDIWISIFECISSLAQIGRLMLTCRRFYTLASPLRRLELNWTTSDSTLRKLNGWMGAYRKSIALPQKLTLRLSMQIRFVPWAADPAYIINQSLRQYVVMHACIPFFTSLREVVLHETTVSPYTYTVLATLPALRSLSLLRCTFSGLLQPPAPAIAAMFLSLSFLPGNSDHHQEQYHEQEQKVVQPTTFTPLPITYLALTPKMPINYYYRPLTSVPAFHHPLNILHTICASTISTLCVEWTDYLAALFVLHKWLFPALRDLDATTPSLSRSLLQSLVAFVHTCASDPKIEMGINEEHLLELQICALEMPLVGEWLQEGRLQVRLQEKEYVFNNDDDDFPFPASFFRPPFYSSPYVHTHDEQPTLDRFAPTQSLSVGSLLSALERLPKTLQILEVKLVKWSIGEGTELLFAIRELFPDIRSLVFRYGEGGLPANLFVTLSGDIIPGLPNLHTLKLISDPACRMIQATRPFTDVDPVLEHTDLEGYLRGWNRYCKSLRCVQVDVGPCWERRFEGDQWVDVTAARDEGRTNA